MRLSARLSACLVLCLSPALLGHCGGATRDGLMGTETGNPPVVDSQKLRLVAGTAGVELVGQAGAVGGSARVRLENRSTGSAAEVTANADGSFRVEVTGSAPDTYEVTVTYQGGTVTLQLAVMPGEVLPPGSDTSLLSCAQLDSALEPTVTSAFAPFAQGCSTHSDCRVQDWNLGCYWQCHYSMVVAGQQGAAVAAAEQSISAACSELESRCQPRPAPANCNQPAPVPECFEGSCRELNPGALSCEDIEARAGQLVNELFASVDRSCNVDADCTTTVVPGASCAYSCYFSGPLAASAVARLRQGIQTIEEGLCGAHERQSCPPAPQPPCAGPGELDPASIVCVDNRCTLREEP